MSREDLGAQVEDWERAWKLNGGASGDNGKVPSANETDETETTGNVDQLLDVLDISESLGVWDGKIGGGSEGKKTDQTEEGQGEEAVDAEGGDEEGEADESHSDVVEPLRRVVCSSGETTTEGGRNVVDWVLRVGQTAPVAAVDDEDGKRKGVSKDELGDTSNVHCDGTEEIVVTAESSKRSRGNSSLETAETENGGCVWNQETQKTKQGWVC